MTHQQDYHIHTGFSVDSESQMEAICQVAISRGIDEIAFTDHADFGPLDSDDAFPTTEYLAAIDQCRERYRGQMVIRAGIEVGEPHVFVAEAADVVESGDFDIVLGSAHYAEGMVATWKEDFFDQPLREAYGSYFRQVADLAAHGDFDVLGHLDLVKRDAFSLGRTYDGPEPYADLIHAALRALVDRGKGLELNTSPLRRGQSEPCPSMTILRWYRDLGGEILTLGSDAHLSGTVGADLDVAIGLAKEAGFERLATFRRRKIDWREI